LADHLSFDFQPVFEIMTIMAITVDSQWRRHLSYSHHPNVLPTAALCPFRAAAERNVIQGRSLLFCQFMSSDRDPTKTQYCFSLGMPNQLWINDPTRSSPPPHTIDQS